MRPVDTCAVDGVANASAIRTKAHDPISLAIRNLIPSSKTERFVLSRYRTVFVDDRTTMQAARQQLQAVLIYKNQQVRDDTAPGMGPGIQKTRFAWSKKP